MFVVGLIVEGEKVEGIILVEKFVAELTHTFPFTEIVPLGHGVHDVDPAADTYPLAQFKQLHVLCDHHKCSRNSGFAYIPNINNSETNNKCSN